MKKLFALVATLTPTCPRRRAKLVIGLVVALAASMFAAHPLAIAGQAIGGGLGEKLGGIVPFDRDPPAGVQTPTIASSSGEQLGGIVTFRQDPPTGAQLAALRALGLEAQGLKRLPMAIVRGTPAQLASAITSGVAVAFYPNERFVYHSTASNGRIGADAMHTRGFTGKDMQIAIVDSGIDATHPDLADHVKHNVKIIGPEYARQPADSPPGNIVVPVDEGPYSNTDLGWGHGTAVAGVVAADGHTPLLVGVAPDADLIGYSIGDVAQMLTIVAAFDHILDHSPGGTGPDWGIDVVNNSWGSFIWSAFDPAHPVNVATKALTDNGIVVVFAAGNAGDAETEMTLNRHAVAPWTISVAATTPEDARAPTSSNGLIMDNSQAVALTEGHVRFIGDRLGIYHPTIAAPGLEVLTTCTATGRTATPGCLPNGNGPMSGTSFSAPHVAGLAALLRQAQPGLSVSQIRQTLEATAVPTTDRAPFWQVGYGLVDGDAALDLVLSKNFKSRLKKAHKAAEARALASRDWRVKVSEHWSWKQPVASVAGIPDSRDLTLAVPANTEAVKVALAYASLSFKDRNPAIYGITVRDAAGQVVDVTTPSSQAGVSTVLIDLRGKSYAAGAWSLQVEGTLGFVSDPTVDAQVTVMAALLEAQVAAVPPPDGTVSLAFTPAPARSTGVLSPEGCLMEPGQPIGALAPPPTGGACHSAVWGWAGHVAETPAEFTSAPFAEPVLVEGAVGLVVYLADSLRPTEDAVSKGFFFYAFDEISPDGSAIPLGSGETLHGADDGRNQGEFSVAPHEVAAGNRLRLRLSYANPGPTTSVARMLFGGSNYGDAGITLTVK